jgi:pimeloyl-ACP methyl ester carboxylesterase
MSLFIPLLCTALLAEAPKVDSRLEQVGPVPANGQLTRSPNQTRAVILIHGFVAHLRSDSVSKAAFRPWQKPDCLLVKTLQREADVFSFAYGENVTIDVIVQQSGLRQAVSQLKKLGYKEIVLIGHSAGGLVARQFVEDFPDAGVTKVIQVCSPNGGTPSAKIRVHAVQQPFVDCLTLEAREKALKERANKRIPSQVEFVCVLGYLEDRVTDGVVPCMCQWSPDLRRQCIPVVPLGVGHHQSTRTPQGAEALARLVREKQPRWDTAHVDQLCKELFKN